MKIDFYVCSIHEVILWENIIKKLNEFGVSAYLILEPPGSNIVMGVATQKSKAWVNDANSTLRVPVMTDPIFEICQQLASQLNIPVLYKSRYDADAVATHDGVGHFHKYENLKFRTMYGVGAVTNPYGCGLVNTGFDGIFANGKLSKQHTEKVFSKDIIHIYGFPKWVVFFRNELNNNKIKADFGITNNKPNVVYLPTWAENSSLDKFSDDILKISENYNLIIKPHHKSIFCEDERFNPFHNIPNVYTPSEQNLIYYYSIADIIIGDVRSGGFTEAFLVDCPIIGLSPNSNPNDDHLIDNIENAATILRQKTNFNQTIDELLHSKINKDLRYHFRNLFFEDLNGNDDTIAALKMIEAIENNDEIKLHKRTYAKVNGPIFSVIISGSSQTDTLRHTLDSLNNQSIDPDLFEVIFADYGNLSSSADTITNYHSKYKLKYIKGNNQSKVSANNNAVAISKGKYLLFINDDLVPSQNLLEHHLKIHLYYNKLSNKVAVKGSINFLPDYLDTLFVETINNNDALFAINSAPHENNVYEWNYCIFNNLSIKKEYLLNHALFDENFDQSIVSDLELGIRLQNTGVHIVYFHELTCTSISKPNLDSFLTDRINIGRDIVKLSTKQNIHPILEKLGLTDLSLENLETIQNKLIENKEFIDNIYQTIKDIAILKKSQNPFVTMGNQTVPYKNLQEQFVLLLEHLCHYYYLDGIIQTLNTNAIWKNKFLEFILCSDKLEYYK